jgi:hypothetical protein
MSWEIMETTFHSTGAEGRASAFAPHPLAFWEKPKMKKKKYTK